MSVISCGLDVFGTSVGPGVFTSRVLHSRILPEVGAGKNGATSPSTSTTCATLAQSLRLAVALQAGSTTAPQVQERLEKMRLCHDLVAQARRPRDLGVCTYEAVEHDVTQTGRCFSLKGNRNDMYRVLAKMPQHMQVKSEVYWNNLPMGS